MEPRGMLEPLQVETGDERKRLHRQLLRRLLITEIKTGDRLCVLTWKRNKEHGRATKDMEEE